MFSFREQHMKPQTLLKKNNYTSFLFINFFTLFTVDRLLAKLQLYHKSKKKYLKTYKKKNLFSNRKIANFKTEEKFG